MTPTQVKTLLESGVLQAYAEGKQLQFKDPVSDKYWLNYTPSVSFSPFTCLPDIEWRVKPEKKTGWINIYPQKDAIIYKYNTREEADHNAHEDRIACIEITYYEGEGL